MANFCIYIEHFYSAFSHQETTKYQDDDIFSFKKMIMGLKLDFVRFLIVSVLQIPSETFFNIYLIYFLIIKKYEYNKKEVNEISRKIINFYIINQFH